MKHEIILAVDTQEAEQFCAWLNNQGHDASIGNTTGDTVDGWPSSAEEVQGVMESLWNEYCAQHESQTEGEAMSINDLEIEEIIIDTENGFFEVVFKGDELKSLQCCLENDGSTEENGRTEVRYKKEIIEPDSGYDWGISKDVNEWAVEQGLADWPDINTFLCDKAQAAGVTVSQNRSKQYYDRQGFVFVKLLQW